MLPAFFIFYNLLIDCRVATHLKHGFLKSFYPDFSCLLSSENSYIYMLIYFLLFIAYLCIWRPLKVVPQYC